MTDGWVRASLVGIILVGVLLGGGHAVGPGRAATPTVAFSQTVYQEETGDVAEITIYLNGTDRAVLGVGSREVNFYFRVEIRDRNGDGKVTVRYNTYLSNRLADGRPGRVLRATGTDEVVASSLNVIESVSDLSRLLAPNSYGLSLRFDGKERAVAALDLEERSMNVLQSWIAPRDYAVTGTPIRQFKRGLSPSDTVAKGDHLVLRIDTSGIFGLLAAQNGSTPTRRFVQFLREPGVSLTVVQQNPAPNRATKLLDVTNAGSMSVRTDRANDSVFVAIETGEIRAVRDLNDDGSIDADEEVTTVAPGDRFRATFRLSSETIITENDQSVSVVFEVVDRTATISVDERPLTVFAAPNQTIHGSTTVAPGTSLRVWLMSRENPPFLMKPTAIVRSDGTFAVTTDYFTKVPVGANFQVSVREPDGTTLSETISGVVKANPTANLSFATSRLLGDSTARLRQVALSAGGFVALHLHNATGDVIGASPYLASGSYDDLVVSLDEEVGGRRRVVGVVHLDSNGNEEFDPGIDEPYVESGSPVTASAVFIEVTPTATRTRSPTQTRTRSFTPSATRSPTPSHTPSDTPIRRTPIGDSRRSTDTTAGVIRRDEGGGFLPDVPVGPVVALGLATLLVASLRGYVRRSDEDTDRPGGTPSASSGGGSPGDGGDSADSSGPPASPDDAPRPTSTTNGDAGRSDQQPTRSRDTRGRAPVEIPSPPSVSVSYAELEKGDVIGRGGNADVYEAVLPSRSNAPRIAVKEPRFEGTISSNEVERVLEEAETWDRLDDNEYIVGLLDWGAKPIPWIAMEYMDGGHLGDRAGEMEPAQAVWTALCVTRGVWHAHRQGVVHLDLKPANVLFRTTPDDAWDVPKVADWGLSKVLLEHSGSVEGYSPTYAAPEQFDRKSYGEPDEQTDVYQLGTVFYELFTGHPPFAGSPAEVMHAVLNDPVTPPTERAPALPPSVDEMLLRALETEKSDRYESLLYLRDDLMDVYEAVRTD